MKENSFAVVVNVEYRCTVPLSTPRLVGRSYTALLPLPFTILMSRSKEVNHQHPQNHSVVGVGEGGGGG
jgi:hypothetical protein